ncbi:radical SAM protein [Mesorhizobium sp.]|uniref:radical SAM protein n=1 Tax=Mesorhizobium sp. TaxID=1871066 RepID=UPI000FEAA9B3|nr:radical SAM protein [Mesorhizobium sp.]RWB31647.1 MAG: radical SAM protein [Mesorhizobium sp.]
MQTEAHFVAMPLAYPFHPSSQLGYLHGYAKSAFDGRIGIHSHHAFLPVLHRAVGLRMGEFFQRYSLVGEEILYLCCALSALNHGETDFLPAESYEAAFQRYHRYSFDAGNESQQFLVPIAHEQVAALTEAMEFYVAHHLAPALKPDALNLVGFTASFCQVFGSIFAARHLARLTTPDVVCLFGGSSFSLPEGRRTLAAWGVDGLIVKGAGEMPLGRIIEAALALPEGMKAQKIRTALGAAGGNNVATVRDAHVDVELAFSQRSLDQLPDPDYDDYFADLRDLCQDESNYHTICNSFVSLPIEGSRGCFAKCDFCHNPNITTVFRSLTGEQVARRTLRLVERYGVENVTFVDSVSNTWAEDYADFLLDRKIELQAFMELRVHEPELFWTKMALCGAVTLQLGIEAISSPLLRAMKKGTSVIQNLAATKFMTEMGIRDASNLIIHHPRSTVADVEETIRIMQLCEHLPVFNLSRFVVSYASPLYNELPKAKKEILSRGFDWLPPEMAAFGWPRHLSYTWPIAWTDPTVTEAWLHFQGWYDLHLRDLAERQVAPSVTVEDDDDDTLVINDTRFGRSRRLAVAGLDAQVAVACHEPRKLWHLARDLPASESAIGESLVRLEKDKIIVRVEDDYLTLALRPKHERIAAYDNRSRQMQPASMPRATALHT